MSWLTLLGQVESGLNGLLGARIMLVSPLLTADATRNRYEVWASVTVGGIIMMFGMARLESPKDLRALSRVNLLLRGLHFAIGTIICVAPNEISHVFDALQHPLEGVPPE